MFACRIRILGHPMEWERLNTCREGGVRIAILSPAVHLEQEVASGASSRHGELQGHLVARAHDHELVVDVAQQIVYTAESCIKARRWVPEGSRGNMIVEECIRLCALRVNARFRESAKMQIGGVERYERGLHASIRSALTQEDFIPIHAQIGDDSDLAARGK